jgi:hypothetical protein
MCIIFGHSTLHRQNLANIGLVWSKKKRRSLTILDTAVYQTGLTLNANPHKWEPAKYITYGF